MDYREFESNLTKYKSQIKEMRDLYNKVKRSALDKMVEDAKEACADYGLVRGKSLVRTLRFDNYLHTQYFREHEVCREVEFWGLGQKNYNMHFYVTIHIGERGIGRFLQVPLSILIEMIPN